MDTLFHQKCGNSCNRKIQFVLPHVPVDDQTMKNSITKLINTTKNPPDISAGYGVWKEAIDAGDGGVFNIEFK